MPAALRDSGAGGNGSSAGPPVATYEIGICQGNPAVPAIADAVSARTVALAMRNRFTGVAPSLGVRAGYGPDRTHDLNRSSIRLVHFSERIVGRPADAARGAPQRSQLVGNSASSHPAIPVA